MRETSCIASPSTFPPPLFKSVLIKSLKEIASQITKQISFKTVMLNLFNCQVPFSYQIAIFFIFFFFLSSHCKNFWKIPIGWKAQRELKKMLPFIFFPLFVFFFQEECLTCTFVYVLVCIFICFCICSHISLVC